MSTFNTEHKHINTTLDTETNSVYCLDCKNVVMTVDQLRTLQDLNRRFFNEEIGMEEYQTSLERLKEQVDATKTN